MFTRVRSGDSGQAESPFLQELQPLPPAPGDRFDRGAFANLESPFLHGELSVPASEESGRTPSFAEEPELDEEWGLEHDLPQQGPSPLDALSPSELKAVRITSTFETGRAGSFGGLTGNFDGQGLSFGLMNFAWKAGSLHTLLKAFLRDHPAAFASVFGPDAARFQDVVSATKPDPDHPKRRVRDLDLQMDFARKVLNDSANKIRKPWSDHFGRLERSPEFSQIQVGAVRKALERARYWCNYFGLKSERAFVFMFDLVSSHGGAWLNAPKFHDRRRNILRSMLAAKEKQTGAPLTELEKLEVIARMIAAVSDERWRAKVLVRKLWFVKGTGKVHGTAWDLRRDFGVTDAPPLFDHEESPAESFLDDREEPQPWGPQAELDGQLEPFRRRHDEESYGADDDESYGANDDESYGAEEEWGQPETEGYACSPSEGEEPDDGPAREAALDDESLDDTYVEEEDEELAFEEGQESEAPSLADYGARIVNNKPRNGAKPAEVALIVDRWAHAERNKLRGARLEIYECDIDEPNRSDRATATNVRMAELTLDLEPSAEFLANPGRAGIPRVTVSNAKWANPTLEKSYKATRNADFLLWVGTKVFPLWIPRQDILEEGNAAEIGFVLDDAQGHRIERTSIALGQTAAVSIPDHLRILLTIPGRFDDPLRDATLELDGTNFDEFLRGGNRRTFISKWLDEHAALKEAAGEPGAELKTGDILKAWFVIHDVGVGASLSDKRFKASDAATKKGAVHGFLNRAGYFAATHDLVTNRQGTVYEFMSKNGLKQINGRTINIETVPDIQADVPNKSDGTRGEPSNPGLYASIGYRRKSGKVTYYKWTKAAFDALADLYIFASARARHLLTITVHKEMDRNLAQSILWREYSAAEMRAGSGKHWNTARDHPGDYHGDPYGFNVQALYDRITAKLNALGGRQMPAGARYGIHPRRVSKADGEDIGNGDSQKNSFPHQSDPTVRNDTGLKKKGWWNT